MDNLKLEERLTRIENLLIANKKVLTMEEVCNYTGIANSYMYKLTSQSRIPHSKPLGKLIFFDKEKIDNWLLQNNKKSSYEIEQEALGHVFRNKTR
jgi:excisionase family DNA binding protein